MNGEQIRSLNTSLLGGNAMDIDLFYLQMNLKKNEREMMRDWMALRTLDTSITFASSDSYTSTKTLPARFLRTYSMIDSIGIPNSGVFLIDSNGSKLPLRMIKLSEIYDYKDLDGYCYIDHKNKKIGRTGTKAGTLYLNFIQATVDISALDADLGWTMPPNALYGALLAYDVAVEEKGGIDWDVISGFQVPYNQRKIDQLSSNLATWDARLQQQELGV